MSSLDEQYWEWCRTGELRLQRCSSCAHWRFPPSGCCPECLSFSFTWEPVSGLGTVWSWIRMHQRYFADGEFDLPYDVAFVELDEGPRMISSVIAVDGRDPALGDRLTVVFDPTDGDRVVPKFRVVDAAQVATSQAR